MVRFKKGDKVITTRSGYYYSKGQIGVVNEHNSAVPFVLFDNGGEHAVSEERMELIATSKSGMRFKIKSKAHVFEMGYKWFVSGHQIMDYDEIYADYNKHLTFDATIVNKHPYILTTLDDLYEKSVKKFSFDLLYNNGGSTHSVTEIKAGSLQVGCNQIYVSDIEDMLKQYKEFKTS